MRKPRIYINIPLANQGLFELDQRAFQHAVKVLRLREGDGIVLFDGSGQQFNASLSEVSKKHACVKTENAEPIDVESTLNIHLALGISKGERMDFAIQKAVELGVTAITPLYTERCVVNLDNKRETKRLEHWRGVIISACEQCGRNRLPELHQPVDIQKNFSLLPDYELKLTLSPYAEQSLKQVSAPAKEVMIMVGPEGGLSEQEIKTAIENGFTAVRMGPRILRTETAALTALSIIQVLWGDMG